MENWAIVIGINQYWRADACLKGAVTDALKMREWLMRGDGGAVPPGNMMLLLNPHQGPVAPRGITALPATQDMIIQAIEQIMRKSGEEGRRFYFYFSGHGLTARMDLSNECGIIPCDFSDILTNKALSLRSIFERFQATRFLEQFFFIDACRNIPWDGEREFRISHYPLPKLPSPPVPPQFIMYATSPGVRAVEITEAGSERGAFTEALLAGLAGERNAKLWSDDSGGYEVRWDSLFRYVRGEVSGRKHAAGGNRAPHLIQEPSQFGENGGSNPSLASFPAEAFPREPLDVHLDPPVAVPQTEVILTDYLSPQRSVFPVTSLPVHFELEPRTYSIRACAADYRSKKQCYRIDLYAPTTVSVAMEPKTCVSGPSAPTSSISKSIEGETLSASLHMRSHDPLSYIELLDNRGVCIETGIGWMYRNDVRPGFYVLRIRTPEGVPYDRPIELSPGEKADITLDTPPSTQTGLFSHIALTSNMCQGDPTILQPSEAIGPAESMQLSTILALAGGAVNEETPYGGKLRGLGITAFRQTAGDEAQSGIQILLGTDSESAGRNDDYYSAVRLRCWALGAPIPDACSRPLPVPETMGLAQAAWRLDPGPYLLSVEVPGHQAVVFAATVLSHRLSLIVSTRDPNGEVAVFQYLPSLTAELPGDPRYEAARFPVLRRLEYIQRSFMVGRIEQAYRNARELLTAKWMDPMAGLLGSYLLMRLGKTEELDVPARNLTEYFGEVSDSHVITAEYETKRGNEAEAVDAFRRALDHGIPMMSDGLEKLISGMERFSIHHPRAGIATSLHAGRIRGLLWSACPLGSLGP